MFRRVGHEEDFLFVAHQSPAPKQNVRLVHVEHFKPSLRNGCIKNNNISSEKHFHASPLSFDNICHAHSACSNRGFFSISWGHLVLSTRMHATPVHSLISNSQVSHRWTVGVPLTPRHPPIHRWLSSTLQKVPAQTPGVTPQGAIREPTSHCLPRDFPSVPVTCWMPPLSDFLCIQ